MPATKGDNKINIAFGPGAHTPPGKI